MKAEYDVKIPRNLYKGGTNAAIFWEFYDGSHNTAKYTFDKREDAQRLYNSAQNIISRHVLYDVRASIRKNEVYFEKVDVEK